MTRPTLFVDDGQTTIPLLARRFMARINSGQFLALTPAADRAAAASPAPTRPGMSTAPTLARRDWTDVSDEPGVDRGP
jgi:hypothetical protein